VKNDAGDRVRGGLKEGNAKSAQRTRKAQKNAVCIKRQVVFACGFQKVL
jgi:hypothetical protein